MKRKQGVILSYILMLFEITSTLLLTPFLLMTLGQTEYGVYKLASSLTAYLLLLDLGLGNAVIRYISKFRANKDRDSESKFFGIAIIFYFVVSIVSIVGGIILILQFSTIFDVGLSTEEVELGRKLLFIITLNIAVTLGTTVYSNIVIAYEKFSVSKGVLIIQVLLRVILTILVLKLGFGSVGVVLINFITTIICRGYYVIYVFKRLKLRPMYKNVKLDFIKDIVFYSSWILIQMIATQINSSIDQILLGALVPSSATIIAVYSVGTQLVQYFQSVGSSFNSVLMPGVVRLVEKKHSSYELCNEMVRIGRIILMVLGIIWSGFIAFGRHFITLWAGNVNIEAYIVAGLLLTVYLFILTEAIGSQILWAKNEHKEQAILKLCVVVINIALSIILIKWNPLLGATIGTFISLLVGDIFVMNIVFAKKLKISLRQYYGGLFKGLFPIILIVTVLGISINRLPLIGWGGLILKIGLFCIVYLILLWFAGMNKYEKNLFGSLLKINRNH